MWNGIIAEITEQTHTHTQHREYPEESESSGTAQYTQEHNKNHGITRRLEDSKLFSAQYTPERNKNHGITRRLEDSKLFSAR